MGRAIADHVRRNLFRFRELRRLSHSELGRAAGFSAFEIENYESGARIITCEALYRFAEALEVPIASFFEGLSLPRPPDESEPHISQLDALELMAMVKAYHALAAPARERARDYIRSLAGDGPEDRG